MERFRDKTAVITGAASGIGAATARRMLAEGASLGICDLHEKGLAAMVAELGGLGERVFARQLDVSEEAALAAFIFASVVTFLTQMTYRFTRVVVWDGFLQDYFRA